MTFALSSLVLPYFAIAMPSGMLADMTSIHEMRASVPVTAILPVRTALTGMK